MRHSEAYLAWRESEAYQVPMTEEGEEKANQRWLNFQKGWNAALKESMRLFPQPYQEYFGQDIQDAIQELESK